MSTNRFRQSAFLIAFCVCSGTALPAFSGEPEICHIAHESIVQASEIRGLKIKKQVPCEVHDREAVKGFLVEQINKKSTPEKLRNEAAIAKAVGFIPQDFDYVNGLIDLYLSQLGGYYDPDRKHFVMAQWLPDMVQSSIAVHEQTHALQDQYFDLKNFVDENRFSTDEILARSALVEGDATAVMLDYQRKLLNQPPLRTEANVDSFIMQSLLGISLSAGASAVPESLKMMLIFPYASGTRFVHSLLHQNGYQSVSDALRSPPRSTEEILHPEKFGKERDFVPIEVADLLAARESILYADTLGEFLLSAVLNECINPAERARAPLAAAGWGGDRVALVEDADSKKRAVVWKIRWDSAEDAADFFQIYSSQPCAQPGRTVTRPTELEVTVRVAL